MGFENAKGTVQVNMTSTITPEDLMGYETLKIRRKKFSTTT